MLGTAYRCPNAMTMPWNELPYVASLTVENAAVAERILKNNMSLEDAAAGIIERVTISEAVAGILAEQGA